MGEPALVVICRARAWTANTLEQLYFVFGTLRYPPLARAVLGQVADEGEACLEGAETCIALTAGGIAQSFPILAPKAGGRVPGQLISLDAAARERLAFYELGYRAEAMRVIRGDGTPVEAMVLVPDHGRWTPGPHWDFEAWVREWGAVCLAAVPEYMALMGRVTPEVATLRYPMILVRAASRLRAEAEPSPAELRRVADPEDVVIESCTQGYVRFFAVEDYRLRHRRFSGGMSRDLDRAAFVSGDATVVLPYDPVRDRVLLVEQIRVGPLARGARNPWQLEAIAGRVDPEETPHAAALREAGEEAGISLSHLIPAPRFYPSPGAKTEYIYCYLAIADLPDGVARPGGLEAEGEDIRPHLVTFGELMHLIETGEAENGPLIVLALWLAQKRDGLRNAAGLGNLA